jgi:hypothetical protein
MKFSKNFDRDWDWYLKYKDTFTFSGSPPKKIEKGDKYTAKEAFYLYDSQGKLVPTKEPELLLQIFKCKESINFNIRMWAEGRADGTLPAVEFSKEAHDKQKQYFIDNGLNFGEDYFTVEEEFELLPWMVEAVEKQKHKYYKF